MIKLLRKLFKSKPEETTIELIKQVDNRCICKTGGSGWCQKHHTDWV